MTSKYFFNDFPGLLENMKQINHEVKKQSKRARNCIVDCRPNGLENNCIILRIGSTSGLNFKEISNTESLKSLQIELDQHIQHIYQIINNDRKIPRGFWIYYVSPLNIENEGIIQILHLSANGNGGCFFIIE